MRVDSLIHDRMSFDVGCGSRLAGPSCRLALATTSARFLVEGQLPGGNVLGANGFTATSFVAVQPAAPMTSCAVCTRETIQDNGFYFTFSFARAASNVRKQATLSTY
jgi:hypothetical protein